MEQGGQVGLELLCELVVAVAHHCVVEDIIEEVQNMEPLPLRRGFRPRGAAFRRGSKGADQCDEVLVQGGDARRRGVQVAEDPALTFLQGRAGSV